MAFLNQLMMRTVTQTSLIKSQNPRNEIRMQILLAALCIVEAFASLNIIAMNRKINGANKCECDAID